MLFRSLGRCPFVSLVPKNTSCLGPGTFYRGPLLPARLGSAQRAAPAPLEGTRYSSIPPPRTSPVSAQVFIALNACEYRCLTPDRTNMAKRGEEEGGGSHQRRSPLPEAASLRPPPGRGRKEKRREKTVGLGGNRVRTDPLLSARETQTRRRDAVPRQ